MHLTLERYYELHDIFEEIVKHYGLSSSEIPPQLILYHNSKGALLGEFHDEEEDISINIARCKNMKEAIKTIIHEYQHYLQPRSGGWYDRYFTMGYTYETHPYEVQANEVADRDVNLFTNRVS